MIVIKFFQQLKLLHKHSLWYALTHPVCLYSFMLDYYILLSYENFTILRTQCFEYLDRSFQYLSNTCACICVVHSFAGLSFRRRHKYQQSLLNKSYDESILQHK